MNILDNNGIIYMVKQKIVTDKAFFITPDIQDEFEAGNDRRLPENIINVFGADWFDKAQYLQSYKEMLNKYGSSSFYNLTGFGDISILAMLKTQEMVGKSMLLPEDIEVITGDNGLSKKIRREFGDKVGTFGGSIKITNPGVFFKTSLSVQSELFLPKN